MEVPIAAVRLSIDGVVVREPRVAFEHVDCVDEDTSPGLVAALERPLVPGIGSSAEPPAGWGRHADRYARCMTQLVTRVDDELLASVDELVARGDVASRSEAVRDGLRRLVNDTRRRRAGQAIIDGYRAVPQSETEGGWPDKATVAMIEEEPW